MQNKKNHTLFQAQNLNISALTDFYRKIINKNSYEKIYILVTSK